MDAKDDFNFKNMIGVMNIDEIKQIFILFIWNIYFICLWRVFSFYIYSW